MPSAETKLSETTLIDISHESLIGNWRGRVEPEANKRLKEWVEDESISARKYHLLVEFAGRSFPLKGENLKEMLDWRKRNEPNPDWARRYNDDVEAFHKALGYLTKFEARVWWLSWLPLPYLIVEYITAVFTWMFRYLGKKASKYWEISSPNLNTHLKTAVSVSPSFFALNIFVKDNSEFLIYRWIRKFILLGFVLFIVLIRDRSRMPVRQPTLSNAEWTATVINASVYWFLVDVVGSFIRLFDLWHSISNPVIRLVVLFVGVMVILNLGWAVQQRLRNTG